MYKKKYSHYNINISIGYKYKMSKLSSERNILTLRKYQVFFAYCCYTGHLITKI